ncbi:MAG: ferritin family protein [Stellaceae bacterium]
MKNFSDLNQQELLALAITLDEEGNRTYSDLAEVMRETYPGTARVFAAMAEEENGHRHRLLDLYRERFGEHIPLIRRQDVKGFLERKSAWLLRPLGLEKVRSQAELMEAESKRRRHEARAEELEAEHVPLEIETEEREAERRLFLPQIVQPGLAGLMDGSVSTLAPLFAAAFATQRSWPTFLVGLAAALGAGISMGFAEALSDNGSLTGRGSPWLRGLVCGAMTALRGLGHTLPFLVPSFTVATSIAGAVVIVELAANAWISNRYMDTPLFSAAAQIVGGGFLVFATGVVIGSG